MRKKKFYKKHKLAIILGLLATANLSIIGFATFGVRATDPTISTLPDVDVNVGEVTSFKFTSLKFTPFKLHTDGFYDDTTKTLSEKATLKIETEFENPLPPGSNFEISLNNESDYRGENDEKFDFFACLTAIKIKVGSYSANAYSEYKNNTLTYSDVSGVTLGIDNVATGSLNFEFTFTVKTAIFNSTDGNFYTDVFKKIHNQNFVFTLSMKSMG